MNEAWLTQLLEKLYKQSAVPELSLIHILFAKSWALTFPSGMPRSPSGELSITLQRSR